LNRAITYFLDGADWPRRLEQTVTVLIGLFVFFTPFPHTTAIKEMTFYLPLAGMLYLAFSKKRVFSWMTPLTMPFAVLAAWCAVGFLFALDRPNTFHDILTHLLKYYAVYFLVVQFYPSQRGFDTLARIIVTSTALFSAGAIVYFYPVLGHSFSERLGHSGRFSFFEMSANYMGFVTVFAAMLSANQFFKEDHKALKALLVLCFVSTVTATLLTQTRGAIIALALAIILFGMSNRRGLVLAVLLSVLIASVIFAPSGLRERFSLKRMQNSERIGIVLMYWEMIKEHPVKGIGFGMELLQNKEFMTPYYERVPEADRDPGFHVSPHNFYLDVAVRLGVVGLLLYLGIIFAALRMAWLARGSTATSTNKSDSLCLAASFVVFLVQSIFADSSFGAPAIVFYLHLAMITILWKGSREIPAAGMTRSGRTNRRHRNIIGMSRS
jgi:O-antigen ligase